MTLTPRTAELQYPPIAIISIKIRHIFLHVVYAVPMSHRHAMGGEPIARAAPELCSSFGMFLGLAKTISS